MHEKAKFVCFNYMQPHKVKFKSVQINMKKVSYTNESSYCIVGYCNIVIVPYIKADSDIRFDNKLSQLTNVNINRLI